jgi:hypothetical protein
MPLHTPQAWHHFAACMAALTSLSIESNVVPHLNDLTSLTWFRKLELIGFGVDDVTSVRGSGQLPDLSYQ